MASTSVVSGTAAARATSSSTTQPSSVRCRLVTPSTSLEESSANCRHGLCGHLRAGQLPPGLGAGCTPVRARLPVDDCFDVDLLVEVFFDADFFVVPVPAELCSAMSSLSCSSLAVIRRSMSASSHAVASSSVRVPSSRRPATSSSSARIRAGS